MIIKIIKIWAVGCSKRFMWFKIGCFEYCVRISDDLYHHLKECGVPTSQSLRYKK